MPLFLPCSFAGVEWELFQVDSEGEGPSDAVPLLKGTRAALVCRKQGLHEYGDHFLLVGQVCLAEMPYSSTLSLRPSDILLFFVKVQG